MTRITTTILIFMLLANGGVTIMTGSGLSEDLGVTLAPGVEKAMDDVLDNAKKGFSPNAAALETLYFLFVAGMSTFNVLISGVFSLPSMFLNLGFPEWIVVPLFAPMYVISTLELIYMATGRSTL